LRPLRATRGSDLGAVPESSAADVRRGFRQLVSVATRWQRGVVARAIEQGRAFVALARGIFSRQTLPLSGTMAGWNIPTRPLSGGGGISVDRSRNQRS
jgi:hypothetical protein